MKDPYQALFGIFEIDGFKWWFRKGAKGGGVNWLVVRYSASSDLFLIVQWRLDLKTDNLVHSREVMRALVHSDRRAKIRFPNALVGFHKKVNCYDLWVYLEISKDGHEYVND